MEEKKNGKKTLEHVKITQTRQLCDHAMLITNLIMLDLGV